MSRLLMWRSRQQPLLYLDIPNLPPEVEYHSVDQRIQIISVSRRDEALQQPRLVLPCPLRELGANRLREWVPRGGAGGAALHRYDDATRSVGVLPVEHHIRERLRRALVRDDVVHTILQVEEEVAQRLHELLHAGRWDAGERCRGEEAEPVERVAGRQLAAAARPVAGGEVLEECTCGVVGAVEEHAFVDLLWRLGVEVRCAEGVHWDGVAGLRGVCTRRYR
ncbi:hypothetical protein C8R46DRAFT_1065498 [Mycena filopes]|nr:hypothetical protein C8R46DRAFT_1065498 [Mycena filopes]